MARPVSWCNSTTKFCVTIVVGHTEMLSFHWMNDNTVCSSRCRLLWLLQLELTISLSAGLHVLHAACMVHNASIPAWLKLMLGQVAGNVKMVLTTAKGTTAQEGFLQALKALLFDTESLLQGQSRVSWQNTQSSLTVDVASETCLCSHV